MIKVLFISYYFKPDKGVAAQRLSYWASYIKRHISDIEVDVITTSGTCRKNESTIDNIIVVPNNNKGWLKTLFRSDLGAAWFEDIKQYFKRNQKKYDTVIITGNPFLHFFIVRFLKRKMKCNIILDFRDPFSKNQRTSAESIYLTIKRRLLTLVEYFFCEYADKVIVMNSSCEKLLCCRDKSKVEIINNGFDEISLAKTQPILAFENTPKSSLIYLGSFAKDRNMFNVVEANKSIGSVFNLLHVGREAEQLDGNSGVKCTGLVSYVTAIGYAKSCDVGLILASGKYFESTTKIFDYIGINIPILIVTNGIIKTGSIQELVKDYPLVWWAENNIESIVKTLLLISNPRQESASQQFDSSPYSRKKGLQQLTNIIIKLDKKTD